MGNLHKIAALYDLLNGLEADLGLSDLSHPQKSVLCAIELLSEDNDEVPLQDIQNHRLMSDVSRPTFFRSLKYLLENEYLTVNYYKGYSAYRIKR